MRYDYTNDNDITASANLNAEDRALDAVLSRIEQIMSDLGDVPFAGYYCD